jgi:hypothetical protein
VLAIAPERRIADFRRLLVSPGSTSVQAIVRNDAFVGAMSHEIAVLDVARQAFSAKIKRSEVIERRLLRRT